VELPNEHHSASSPTAAKHESVTRATVVQPLSYDTPRAAAPTAWLHYVARICGIAPLVVGMLVFLLFLITREEGFAFAGFLTILAGTCLAMVGIVCAGVFLYQARALPRDERAAARLLGHHDIQIILANFLVAGVMAWAGIRML
jgi:hypothetical protein